MMEDVIPIIITYNCGIFIGEIIKTVLTVVK